MMKRVAANSAVIHIGDSTHHHDQEITLVNFSPIKRIVSRPVNPIPPEVFVFLSLIAIPLFLSENKARLAGVSLPDNLAQLLPRNF